MTDYVIGDVQGCHDELLSLVARLDFQAGRDRLIFAGDLVNRGPQSLQTLRYIKGLGPAAVAVLGNHDLHLLAVAHGGRGGPRDTLDELLAAPDAGELLEWLARCPLAWRAQAGAPLVIHAGLPPEWSVDEALDFAAEASALLHGPGRAGFLSRMYGNEPQRWSPALQGTARIRFIVNCLTRLRYLHRDGRIDLRHKGAPGTPTNPDLLPWFLVPERRSQGQTIVFGHWSTLGRVHWPEAQVYGLDSGCVWGGALTALDLDSGRLIQQPCSGRLDPGGED